MKFLLGLICALSLWGLTGCASLFNGQSQHVSIRTHPDAEIHIDDQFVGKGQRNILLERDKAHEIKVSLNTCEQTFSTQKSFNKTTLLGLFVDFGLISIPLDFATGAAWNIVPTRLHMQPHCMTLEK